MTDIIVNKMLGRHLDALAQAAILDGYARGNHKAQEEILSTCEEITKRIENWSATNINYIPYPQMTALMVLLAHEEPERYDAFMGTLGNSDAGTYPGFMQLATILQGLGDDHDYTLDESERSAPVLTLGQEHGPDVRGAHPLSVFLAIKDILEHAKANVAHPLSP